MSDPVCYFTSGLCPGLAIGQHIAEGRRQCTGESHSAAQASMRMERSVHVSIFKNQMGKFICPQRDFDIQYYELGLIERESRAHYGVFQLSLC